MPGCGEVGDGGAAGDTRTVLVDYKHDELSSSFIGFFPDRVAVHPGDTVSFRQTWTGEPHSIVFGVSFNDELGVLMDRLNEDGPLPADAQIPELDALAQLPSVMGRDGDPFAVNQNAAQPCYLETGEPPIDPDKACIEQEQPEFDGTHSYYSSGFIPYEGGEGNRYDIRLADDIGPGRYNFFCTLHGVGQATSVVVRPRTESIPPQSAVSADANRQIQARYADPLGEAVRDAERGELHYGGKTHRPPLAGVATAEVLAWTDNQHRRHLHRHGSVNEFIPARLEARAGERVTWTLIGRHTISFNVPRYFPIFTIEDDNTVTINPHAHDPIGWPGRQPTLSRSETARVDAGSWDGDGFRSSGLDWENGDSFSVTFTRSGTYKFACLIHPPMVGEIVVT